MNKSELIAKVAESTSVSKTQTALILDTALAEIAAAMSRGQSVAFTGFGVFAPKFKAARVGKNPRTGEAVEIRAHYAPSFRPGKGLKKALETKAL